MRRVTETYVNQTSELFHVFVGGEEIVTTPTHPFYSPVKGWTDAAQLRAGDILVLVNGEYVVVQKQSKEAQKKIAHLQREVDALTRRQAELTSEILRTFIQKVTVGERSKKCFRNAMQEVKIYYRDVGLLDDMPEADATEAAQVP